MKYERTRVVTAEITVVEKADFPHCYPDFADVVGEDLRKKLNADDVQVKSVQDFYFPKEEEEHPEFYKIDLTNAARLLRENCFNYTFTCKKCDFCKDGVCTIYGIPAGWELK